MPTWISWEVLIRCAIGAAIAFIIYKIIVYKQTDFEIRLRNGSVAFRGRFPAGHQAALTQLLLDDLALDGPVTIRGAWNGRRLRLWFRGGISDGQKQRIRNFLSLTL